MNTSEQIPDSIEVLENKVSPVLELAIFLLKMTVILSATAFLVASAWF
ncbi:hypothetical protein ACWU4D_10745 [Vibrio sp. WJH972]